MTEERPKLQIGLKPEIFREYYYLKAELQAFCRNMDYLNQEVKQN